MSKVRLTILFFFSLFFIGAYSQSHTVFDTLQNALGEEPSTAAKISLLESLSQEYKNINWDSTLFYLEEALLIAREEELLSTKARLYTQMSEVYSFKGDYLRAFEYLGLANLLFEDLDDLEGIGNIHYYKSLIFLNIDRLNEAITFAKKALDIYTQLENDYRICSVHVILGAIYEKLGDGKKALEYNFKSYPLALKANRPDMIASTLNNIAIGFSTSKQIDSSLVYLHKAVQINKQEQFKTRLGVNYHNLAGLFLKKHLLDSAKYYIQKAEEAYNEVGFQINLMSLHELKARLALLNTDTLKAIRFFESIVHSEKQYESLDLKAKSYKALHEIAQEQANFKAALDYHKSYKLFDDSLKTESHTSLVAVKKMQDKYEKRQKSLEIKNKEIKIKAQRKNLFLIISSGLILLILIIGFLLYKLQKAKTQAVYLENKRVESELKFKRKEMAANVMSLMRKNEVVTEIAKSLIEIQASLPNNETKSAIGKITDKLQKIKDKKVWQEFEIRFKEVHSEFYEKLLASYPSLTPSEQKLCAFLRLNMSTKEISELTGIHYTSINNSRSRIRKKLGITDKKDSLVKFLSNI